jgi:tRNA A-37 threonylcarbamoyl transferase component Bud32
MTAQPMTQPVQFGERYWLRELMAVGGMAEIYRARQDAMASFEKDVVIKRLKPDLARDPRLVEMFLDEARIGAGLNHPNVVHVYDVSEQDGIPFIAMELILGEELHVLCRRGLSLGRFLPLEHAVDLMRQAAAGMGYFHHRRDARGRNLDIVHCDISPTNLLVTEDGGLKVIDFGIARARNQRYRDHNAMPGKVSYMAPEQVERRAVDPRTDLFALGVVLYEITVGRRLFRGSADEVVERIKRCDIQPPTYVRRDFPGPLEAVIMRCLERDPDDRYQSAYDLADDLEEFLREAALRSGPVRIARYLDELAVAGGGARRPELVAEAEAHGGGAASAGHEDLDFDRGVFGQFRAANAALQGAPGEWDDLEADESQLEEVLGVAPGKRGAAAARPDWVVEADDVLEEVDDPGAADVDAGWGGEAEPPPHLSAADQLALRAPQTPVPVLPQPSAPHPAMPRPAPVPAAPQPPLMTPPGGLFARPWVLVGAAAAIAAAAVGYALLTR